MDSNVAFDPTTCNATERERLGKCKWFLLINGRLPPIADGVLPRIKAEKQALKRTHNPITRQPFIDQFPKIALKVSNQVYISQKINPKARFINSLQTEAIREAHRKSIDRKRRDVVEISSYDWDLCRSTTRDHRFLRYIQALANLGKEPLNHASHQEVEANADGHLAAKSSLKRSKSAAIIHEQLVKDQQELQEFRNYIENSPFQKKKPTVVLYEKYQFGKGDIKEDTAIASEFMRTFIDFENIGNNMRNRVIQLEAESKYLNVPATITQAIEAAHGTRIATREGAIRKPVKVATPEILKPRFVILSEELEDDRAMRSRNLEKFVQLRKEKRLLHSLDTEYLVNAYKKIENSQNSNEILWMTKDELKLENTAVNWIKTLFPDTVLGN